jgi:hypothetical protein
MPFPSQHFPGVNTFQNTPTFAFLAIPEPLSATSLLLDDG